MSVSDKRVRASVLTEADTRACLFLPLGRAPQVGAHATCGPGSLLTAQQEVGGDELVARRQIQLGADAAAGALPLPEELRWDGGSHISQLEPWLGAAHARRFGQTSDLRLSLCTPTLCGRQMSRYLTLSLSWGMRHNRHAGAQSRTFGCPLAPCWAPSPPQCSHLQTTSWTAEDSLSGR